MIYNFIYYKIHTFIGSLAQSVEHRAFNPLVVRSNRTRPNSHYREAAITQHLTSVQLMDAETNAKIVAKWLLKRSRNLASCV